jgi:competence protein ComEA
VNINTATAEQLQQLPGIGEAKAQAILEERKSRGGFKSVDELLDVRGIGESALERIRPHVTLDGRSSAVTP